MDNRLLSSIPADDLIRIVGPKVLNLTVKQLTTMTVCDLLEPAGCSTGTIHDETNEEQSNPQISQVCSNGMRGMGAPESKQCCVTQVNPMCNTTQTTQCSATSQCSHGLLEPKQISTAAKSELTQLTFTEPSATGHSQIPTAPHCQVSGEVNSQTPTILDSEVSSEVSLPIHDECSPTSTSMDKQPTDECLVCDRKFLTPTALLKHLTDHIKRASSLYLQPAETSPYIAECIQSHPYKCLLCDRRLYTLIGLTNHTTSHIIGRKGSVCSICDETFDNQFRLCAHFRLLHNMRTCEECGICFIGGAITSGNAPFSMPFHLEYSCQVVGKMNSADDENAFRNRQELRCLLLQRSIVVSNGNIKYKCHICGAVCNNYTRKLLRHMQETKKCCEEQKRISTECFQCKTHYSGSEVKSHGCQNYGEFPCALCDKRLLTRISYRSHIVAVHGEELERSKVCRFCGVELALVPHFMDKHMRTHSVTEPPSFSKCFTCKKMLGSESIRSHGCKIFGKFNCKMCGDRFRLRSSFLKHVADVHKTAKAEKCEECGQTFAFKRDLTKHRHQHEEMRRRYLCHRCGKVFRVHYHLHHDDICQWSETEKLISCDLCEKKFTTMHAQQAHVKAVHKHKSCVCDVCGKAFTTNFYLMQHKSFHSEGRPFKCSFYACSQTFKTKSNLVTHEKIHTDSRRIKCNKCGEKFVGYTKLAAHKLRAHKE